MAIPVNATYPINVTVNNSWFKNNYASNYGGGLYTFIYGTVNNQTYMFRNNIFVSNEAGIGSGAMCIFNHGSTAPSSTLYSTIYNCTFKYNKGKVGGCLYIVRSYTGFSGNFIAVKECLFYNNTSTEAGGAIFLRSHKYYQNREYYDPVEFTNWWDNEAIIFIAVIVHVLVPSIFNRNYGGKGATIDIMFYSGRINNVTFNSNRGSVVRVSL